MDDHRGQRQALRARGGPRDGHQAHERTALSVEEDDEEALPFDVEIERRPIWVDVASALVIVASLAAAAKLVPTAAILPFLIVSSVGRRFGSSALHIEVTEDGSLQLGSRFVAKADVRDVWLEDDGSEPRVVVAIGARHELAALYFENRPQAKRFADSFERSEAVAGYLPRPLDLLSSLRFVGIAIAFFGLGSWYGVFGLAFVLLGLRGVWLARQLVVTGDTFELRSFWDRETFRRDSVKRIDVDEGVITLSDRELRFAQPNSRDVHLGAPLWADAIRRRALKLLAQKSKGPTETVDPSESE